jgi:lipid-binding SYLF domain-containing protein
MNQKKVLRLLIATALLVNLSACAGRSPAANQEKIEQNKADIRKVTTETLDRLYKMQPSAQKAVSSAAGYAVFSNFGMKIFVAGGGSGKGLAVDNKTGQETFMKMVELQVGLGLGVKKFRLVWVFENQSDLSKFIDSGWELGGQATAAAKVSGQGGAFAGAMSVSPGVWLYQLTDEGLALELTAKGTKYYKDGDLNN